MLICSVFIKTYREPIKYSQTNRTQILFSRNVFYRKNLLELEFEFEIVKNKSTGSIINIFQINTQSIGNKMVELQVTIYKKILTTGYSMHQ